MQYAVEDKLSATWTQVLKAKGIQKMMTIGVTKLVCTVYQEVNTDKQTYDRLHDHTTTRCMCP